MGIIIPNCLCLNGTRLLGLSLATPESEYDNHDSNHTSIILVETAIPHPTSLSDLRSFSVISLWEANLPYKAFDYMQFVCQVDPVSGIFTVVYYNNGQGGVYYPNGGFQYDFTTQLWSVVSFSSDYKWNSSPASSPVPVVFAWPNSSTLYQAYIGDANIGLVNVGVLGPTSGVDDGVNGHKSATFVNSFNWTLVNSVFKSTGGKLFFPVIISIFIGG
jgi:hypothetical protein